MKLAAFDLEIAALPPDNLKDLRSHGRIIPYFPPLP